MNMFQKLFVVGIFTLEIYFLMSVAYAREVIGKITTGFLKHDNSNCFVKVSLSYGKILSNDNFC